jgi:hypothetical protein
MMNITLKKDHDVYLYWLNIRNGLQLTLNQQQVEYSDAMRKVRTRPINSDEVLAINQEIRRIDFILSAFKIHEQSNENDLEININQLNLLDQIEEMSTIKKKP